MQYRRHPRGAPQRGARIFQKIFQKCPESFSPCFQCKVLTLLQYVDKFRCTYPLIKWCCTRVGCIARCPGSNSCGDHQQGRQQQKRTNLMASFRLPFCHLVARSGRGDAPLLLLLSHSLCHQHQVQHPLGRRSGPRPFRRVIASADRLLLSMLWLLLWLLVIFSVFWLPLSGFLDERKRSSY